jgi:hypothetical protein
MQGNYVFDAPNVDYGLGGVTPTFALSASALILASETLALRFKAYAIVPQIMPTIMIIVAAQMYSSVTLIEVGTLTACCEGQTIE